MNSRFIVLEGSEGVGKSSHIKTIENYLIKYKIDFQDIEDSFEPLRELLDHAYLNDIKGLENPTSENMCLYIWENIKPSLPSIIEVEIKETSATGCRYKGD